MCQNIPAHSFKDTAKASSHTTPNFEKMRLKNFLISIIALVSISAERSLEEEHTSLIHHRVKRLSSPQLGEKATELAKYCVSIRSRTPRKYFGDNHYCGGVIISHKHVLSAAHCTMDKRKIMHRARVLLIVAGTPNRIEFTKGQTVNLPVSKIFVPENFTMFNTNNIAVIVLKGTLPSNNPHIGIINLPTAEPTYNEKHTVLGWGRLYRNGPLASRLLYIDVNLLTDAKCRTLLRTFKPEMMCAGNLNDQYDTNPCAGDIGGPMINNNKTLVGIVSYRVGCGSHTLPSVYTNVWYHLDWITEHMAASVSRCSAHFYILFVCLLLAVQS